MFISAVAFGESYIKKLFERALPSLFGPKGIPSLESETPRLFVYTFPDNASLIKSYLARDEIRYLKAKGDVQIHFLSAKGPTDPRETPKSRGRALASSLFAHAIAECAEKDETFLHVWPDLVYADGVVSTCYQLHRLTGKIIATFNSRVAQKPDQPDFSAETLLEMSRKPRDFVNFFFQHRNFKWRIHSSSDVDEIPGPISGNLIFESPSRRLVFSATPNVIMGKFNAADVSVLADRDCVYSWDHAWIDFLLANNRLMVQTHLDNGMSIEPEPALENEQHQANEIAQGLLLDGVGKAANTLGKPEQDLRR